MWSVSKERVKRFFPVFWMGLRRVGLEGEILAEVPFLPVFYPLSSGDEALIRLSWAVVAAVFAAMEVRAAGIAGGAEPNPQWEGSKKSLAMPAENLLAHAGFTPLLIPTGYRAAPFAS